MAQEQVQGKEIRYDYTVQNDRELATLIFDNAAIVSALTNAIYFEVKSVNQSHGKTTVVVKGNKTARKTLDQALQAIKAEHQAGKPINAEVVKHILAQITEAQSKVGQAFNDSSNDNHARSSKNAMQTTEGHREYERALHECDLIVAIGKAGSGKTYTALKVGVALLQANKISQLVLIRPAKEMGEEIGAVPGDEQQKISRFMGPFIQNLDKICGPEARKKLIESGKIIFQPLGSTRGLTFDDAYIILDEAQNIEARSQNEQQDNVLETLVSRAGYGTKVVVAGSLEQVDVKRSALHGLVRMVEFGLAANVQIPDGAVKTHVQRLTAADVIRSPLAKYMAAVREAMEEQENKPQPSNAPAPR